MKAPLKPKRTDFSFKSFLDDPKFIREVATPNPFGITPEAPAPEPVSSSEWLCQEKTCYRWKDSDGNYYGYCAGFCMCG